MNTYTMKVIILDSETTGIAKTDQVIELAYCSIGSLQCEQAGTQAVIYNTTKSVINSLTKVTRYRPSCSINPFAFAVHNIGLSELLNKPKSSTVDIPDDITYMIGQNISFDKRMLEQSNPELKDKLDSIKYICTMTLARIIDKQMKIGYENHKLDTLAKFYFPDQAEELAPAIHSAGNDVLKTYLVLLKLVEHLPAIETWDELYDFQESMSGTVKRGR